MTPYIISDTFITIVLNNCSYTITKDDHRYAALYEAIKARAWDKIEPIVNTPKAIVKYTGSKVKIVGDKVMMGDKEVHSVIATKILLFMKEGLPFEPLARFLDKLMLNPSKRSVDTLYGYIEKCKMAITEDGDFLAFKSIRHDGKDHHTGTIDNAVGKVVELARNEVSDDPASGCSFGLHVASHNFAVAFKGGDNSVIISLNKINPRDVVSVPLDGNCEKMRVCRYEVVSHSSKQDAKNFSSQLA